MVLIGLEKFGQFHEIVAAHSGVKSRQPSRGRVPHHIRSVQAPPGKHAAFLWKSCLRSARRPVELGEREGSSRRRLLKLWSERAPNLVAASFEISLCSVQPTQKPRCLT